MQVQHCYWGGESGATPILVKFTFTFGSREWFQMHYSDKRPRKWTIQIHIFSKHPKLLKSVKYSWSCSSVKMVTKPTFGGNPASVMRRYCIQHWYLWIAVKLSKFLRGILFWLFWKNYKELDVLLENLYNLHTFQCAKKIFFVILNFLIFFSSIFDRWRL